MDAVITYLCAVSMTYVGFSFAANQVQIWTEGSIESKKILLLTLMGLVTSTVGVIVLLLTLSKHTVLAEPIAWLTGIEYHEPSNNKCD